MPMFRPTKTINSYGSTIHLFWFVRADEEQRNSIEEALNEIVDRVSNENPELKRKMVAGIPWLRNYTPSLADVIDTARVFEMGEGHVLGIDAQSLEDESLLVLHGVAEKKPEIGRTTREEAIAISLGERLFQYTLAELFGERPWTRVPVPTRSPEPTFEDKDVYTLPSHIPVGTKLQENKITLFSLIKLSDEEISALKQDMGDTTNEITIFNWPHETPASQAETYNIFQCVKPDLVAPCDQSFVIFIDATHISGPERAPVVVVACKSTPKSVVCRSIQELMRYEHIYIHAEQAQQVKQLWPLIWHPQNRGSVNNVAVNYPLFYGSSHHYVGTVPRPDWNSPIMRYHSNFIAKPGTAIVAAGAQSPEFMVYILCPVTPEELHILRNIVVDGNGDAVQFLELNLVSREVREEKDEETGQEPSTDSSNPLDPLLAFFDTPGYRAVASPPSTFVFLDNKALDKLFTSPEKPSVPLAHEYHHFREASTGELMAVEEPAYLYASFPINNNNNDLDSALANLATGNMWFWELVGMCSDGMDVAFWSEYKGSMTREMLHVEWNF